MALIQVPYYVPADDSGRGTNFAFADTNTGKYYWDPAGNNPLIRTVNTGESLEQQWIGTDPKTDTILSDPIAVKMLQSGYVPSEGLSNVYINPDTGTIAVSPNTAGIEKIYGGFARGLDPNTGGVIIGDRSNSGAIVQRAIDYRNSIYTGGDWMSNFLGNAAVPLMMGGVGALAFAPVAAAGLAEATPLAEAANAGLPSAAAGTIAPAATTPAASALDAALSAAGDVMLPEGVVAPQGGILQQLVDAGVPAQIVQTLPAAIEKTAINVGLNVLQGKDVNLSNIGSSLLTGTAGVVLGNEVGNSILKETGSSILASAGSGATQGAWGALVSGADPIQTALASATASTIGSIAKDYGINIPQASINNTVGAIANGASLGQALASGAIAAGTGLAKDAISGAMTAYNADQQTAGLQAASDLGNAPTQGFDNNGNPIYRDSSGVWTNDQGVPVDPSTGEPVQATRTADVASTIDQYNAPTYVAGSQDVAAAKSDAASGLSDAELASYGMQKLPDGSIVRIGETAPDSSGAGTRIEIIGGGLSDTSAQDTGQDTTAASGASSDNSWVSGYDLPSGGTTTPSASSNASPVTANVPVAAASTPSATSGTSGTAAADKKAASDYSTYIPPIPGYLRDTMLSTGKPSEGSALWQGIDPKLASILTQRAAHGGAIHPQLMKVLQERGGELVPGPENRMYMRHAKRGFAVTGPGTGQSDDIPTMLADGEYVFDADTVAALGDGSSKAGAEVLDKMRETIRAHKRSAPVDKIPPKAKSPLEYLKMAKRK